jgi:energy-coupling factor transporter ATP-binding protein EcfA2
MAETDRQVPSRTRVLEVRDISKTFGATRALRHVEFSIDAGEVFAVLGQNGSGKSTLVKVLAGFHEPDPGAEIIFDGEPLPDDWVYLRPHMGAKYTQSFAGPSAPSAGRPVPRGQVAGSSPSVSFTVCSCPSRMTDKAIWSPG